MKVSPLLFGKSGAHFFMKRKREIFAIFPSIMAHHFYSCDR
ncbi:hypothetical protein Acin_2251 [Acidaminococcus intestini RyC-MR95]|uniref:Uncharacterized protein n=1 Tax=Acidaminococcus intestini (strain RyC-MR95) TaxID=568816 RepID=G4Q6F6_ACIIR|nr:hypothetical protein Acin_2251 [Acidaminococcus intestini RyC-MR95]